MCNVSRDSNENKKNLEQLKYVLKNILGYKINIRYKDD